jgi:hypothetical protein
MPKPKRERPVELIECIESLRVLACAVGQNRTEKDWKTQLLALHEQILVQSFDMRSLELYKRALRDMEAHLEEMPAFQRDSDQSAWLLAANDFSRALDPTRFNPGLPPEMQTRSPPRTARRRDRLKNWRAEKRVEKMLNSSL